MSKKQSNDELEPMLQAFFDLYNELEPDNELDQFEAIRQGIRYCISNDCDPIDELEDIQNIPAPYVNVQA